MIMKRFFAFLFVSLAALSTWAVQVNTTAGNLAQDVTDLSVANLSLSGTMDARDFKFIASSLNSLTSLDLSDVQVTEYENEEPLFYGIKHYEGNAIPATAFMGMKLQSVILPTTIKKIDVAAFAGCEALESIELPQSLEAIAPYAFTACNKLQSITIPQGLKFMGDGAFSRCAALETATIAPAGEFAIGKDAFQDCKVLSSVTIGQNVNEIMPGAFSGCKALTTPVIEQGSKLVAIGEAAFAASGVQAIALDQCDELASIGMWAFANTSLKNVSLPSSLESLGDGAFYYNVDMEDVNLPETLTSLSNYLLAGNSNVFTDQPVKDGVTTIGDYAFYNWDSVQEFYFPQSVQYIGTKAMAGQVGLKRVIAKPTTVPGLGEEVWAGVPQSRIPLEVGKNVINDYKNAEQWMEFMIADVPTSIDVNTASATNQVKAWFSGTELNVSATSDIASIAIFDSRGVMLTAVAPAAQQAQLDTSSFYGKFYIVSVALSNGSKHNFKLLR